MKSVLRVVVCFVVVLAGLVVPVAGVSAFQGSSGNGPSASNPGSHTPGGGGSGGGGGGCGGDRSDPRCRVRCAAQWDRGNRPVAAGTWPNVKTSTREQMAGIPGAGPGTGVFNGTIPGSTWGNAYGLGYSMGPACTQWVYQNRYLGTDTNANLTRWIWKTDAGVLPQPALKMIRATSGTRADNKTVWSKAREVDNLNVTPFGWTRGIGVALPTEETTFATSGVTKTDGLLTWTTDTFPVRFFTSTLTCTREVHPCDMTNPQVQQFKECRSLGSLNCWTRDPAPSAYQKPQVGDSDYKAPATLKLRNIRIFQGNQVNGKGYTIESPPAALQFTNNRPAAVPQDSGGYAWDIPGDNLDFVEVPDRSSTAACSVQSPAKDATNTCTKVVKLPDAVLQYAGCVWLRVIATYTVDVSYTGTDKNPLNLNQTVNLVLDNVPLVANDPTIRPDPDNTNGPPGEFAVPDVNGRPAIGRMSNQRFAGVTAHSVVSDSNGIGEDLNGICPVNKDTLVPGFVVDPDPDYPWPGSDYNVPPIAVADVTPAAPLSPGDVATFDGSKSSDPDGSVVTWKWSVTGDSGQALPNGTGMWTATGPTQPVDTTGWVPGDYTVTLSVVDNNGKESTESATAHFTLLAPPSAQISSDTTVDHLLESVPVAGGGPNPREVWVYNVATYTHNYCCDLGGGTISNPGFDNVTEPIWPAYAQVNGSASHPGTSGQPIVKYEWDTTGTGTGFDVSSANPAVAVRWDHAGAYAVRLRVTDAAGAHATTTQWMVANTPTYVGVRLPPCTRDAIVRNVSGCGASPDRYGDAWKLFQDISDGPEPALYRDYRAPAWRHVAVQYIPPSGACPGGAPWPCPAAKMDDTAPGQDLPPADPGTWDRTVAVQFDPSVAGTWWSWSYDTVDDDGAYGARSGQWIVPGPSGPSLPS